MVIRRMEPSNVGAVAKLMSAIKPDWWDFEGANQQLQDVGLLAKLVGWYLEEDGTPQRLAALRRVRGVRLPDHRKPWLR